ncbi:right-handed parallel beta-helix repeat-containing protein [Planococcus glaciei]|nr:right-handed parallel beta-helix repeat-containing protein [Planococcus glaciei]QDY44794.1 right-handed parallel beta-helix repeat-containing protein [Planococcus glaciei]
MAKGTDGSGSADTVQFRDFNPVRNDVHVGAYLKIGSGEGSVYHIDAVTSDRITISPDLKEPLDEGSEYAIHIGCGLQTDRGSDNNVYGIYDCHFVGNAGAGLMVRGLYGHHIQGGNFDSNGITGIHIGSGMINTTPAYSNTINHSYFEANGYANVILDYPSGLTVLDPLLAEPVDGTAGDVASITSLRGYYFDFDSTSISYNGRQYGYVAETDCSSSSYQMEGTSQLAIDRPAGARSPAVIQLPPVPPTNSEKSLKSLWKTAAVSRSIWSVNMPESTSCLVSAESLFREALGLSLRCFTAREIPPGWCRIPYLSNYKNLKPGSHFEKRSFQVFDWQKIRTLASRFFL